MTEATTQPDPSGTDSGSTSSTPSSAVEPGPAPRDAADDVATGYAVYDRTIQQYVGAVTSSKPSATDARKAVAKGHSYAIVRV